MEYAKIGTFGESQVGKTCIIKRIVNKKFNLREASSEITSIIELSVDYNNDEYLFKFWDTAGQERYNKLTKQYYQGLHCILLVYDITKRDTFGKIDFWVRTMNEECGSNAFVILIGNKVDLAESREVSTEEGRQLAEKLGMPFFETSACTGENIEELMKTLTPNVINKMKGIETSGNIQLERKDRKRGVCCGGKK